MKAGRMIVAIAWAACMASGAVAAKPMHKCVDVKGKVIYTDLPCPVPAVPPPPPPVPLPCPLTAEQRRNAEHLERQFLLRYPDEEKHREVSLADLREVVARFHLAEARLRDLRHERTSINEDLAFFEHRTLPTDLKARLDANEGRFAAIADVFVGLENEIKTITTRYECERKQFGFLWHGGAPGSSACAAACKTG